MAELEYQRFIRYPISPENKGLAVILKVDATAFVESTIWMEERWIQIKSKIGNCTEIYNGRITYSKDRCLLKPGESSPTSPATTGEIPYPCIPSTVDYTVCLDSEKQLNDILKEQKWTQKTLMKEFHAKNFFLEKSDAIER